MYTFAESIIKTFRDMQKTWKLIMACMTLACASLVMGCGSDDSSSESSIDNPVEENANEPDGSLQDAEAAKTKLNTLGKELVSKVSANDFEDLTVVIDAFNDLGKSSTKALINGDGYSVSNILAAAKGDLKALYAMTRATETYRASEYYGTWTYDETNDDWEQTENQSGKAVATFPAEGSTVTVTVTCSGDETAYTNTEEGITVYIPAQTDATIEWKGNTLAKISIGISNISATSPYAADINATVTVASKYAITASISANSSAVTANTKLTANGETLIEGKAVVGGQNITSEDENIEFEERVNTAEGQVIVLDDAYFTMQCSDVKSLINTIDNITDGSSQTSATAKAAALNQYITGNLRYKSQTAASATIGFEAYIEYQSSTREYWDTQAIITFGDGSKTTFDNLDGDTAFDSFVESLEALIDEFADLIN